MSESFYVRPSGANRYRNYGLEGSIIRDNLLRTFTGINQSPQEAQVTTITVPGTVDASTYKIIFDGLAAMTAEFVATGSTTQDQLGQGLVDAIDAKAAMGRMTASYNTSTNTITLTGTYPGIAVTVTVDGGSSNTLGTPSNTTSAASADRVKLGRLLVSDGYTAQGTKKVYAPKSTLLTKQVITFTYGSVNTGDEVFLEIEFEGQRHAESTTYATSQTATLAALVTAMDVVLDAAFGAGHSIALASNATTITLTADYAGAEFRATSSVSGAGTVSKANTTGPTAATSIARSFAGFSVRRMDVENETIGGDNPSYKANEGVEVISAGFIKVYNDQTLTLDSEVWVDTTAGDNLGRLYNSRGSNRVWIPSELLRWDRSERSGGNANIRRVQIHRAAV